jgi:hypothetical protein
MLVILGCVMPFFGLELRDIAKALIRASAPKLAHVNAKDVLPIVGSQSSAGRSVDLIRLS